MQVEVGAVVEGTVTGITKFGAFVSLPDGRSGLVHISEIANTYVNDVNEFLKLGDKVKVRVLAVTPDGKINLSIKKAEPAPERPNNRPMHGGRRAATARIITAAHRALRARTTVRPSRRDRSAARAGTLRLKTGSSSSCRSRTAAWPATASTATARAAAAAAAAADKTKDGIRPHCVCSGAFFRRKEPIMQVYLSEHIAPSAYARLARHFEIVDNFDHPEQLAAMIIRRAVVPRTVIARAPNLKVIAMHGVSRDTIDTAAAAEYGVPVPNVPGLGAPAVAELAVADLLALNRQLKFVNNGLCAGRFDHFGAEEFVCHEMTGRTLGLVGTGNIAHRVADILRAAFDVRVLCWNPRRTAAECAAWGYEQVATLPELFRRSDFVNVSITLCDATRDLINAPVFAAANPDLLLVNTSRGGIVNEHDLYVALTTGQIRAAASDVFVHEPPACDDPLIHLDNFIATFHIGGSTYESLERVSNRAVDYVFEYTGVPEQKEVIGS